MGLFCRQTARFVLWCGLVPAVAGFGQAETVPGSDSASTPTHYIYEGQEQHLELDPSRIAVRYSEQSSSEERSEALETVEARETELPLQDRWQVVELDEPSPGPAAVDERVRTLVDAPAVEFASPVFVTRHDNPVHMTPRILVRFEEPFVEQAEGLLSVLAPGMEIVKREFGNKTGAFVLRGTASNGFHVLAQANALSRDPRVAWAEPDKRGSHLRPHLDPDDTGYDQQWGWKNTGQFGGVPGYDGDVDAAWDTTTGSATIKVLVMDSGVQQNHPDINQGTGTDTTSQGPGDGGPVSVCDKHGTPVAGIVSATINNALGAAGVAPDALVLSARIWIGVTVNPCGPLIFMDSWLVDALAWGETQGVRVSNSSFGIDVPSAAVTNAYQDTYANGMLHMGAAGNDANPSITYPHNLAVVNAVSNVTPNGTLNPVSNYGSGLSFSAPGTQLYTTDRTGASGFVDEDYLYFTGGSAAAPYAAGVAALILTQDPSLTPSGVEDKMKCAVRDLGAPGFDNFFGWGFLNAERALLAPLGVDTDMDGEDDSCDNCPQVSNPLQSDSDRDGYGNDCDTCSSDAFNDADGDSYCAGDDNCPFIANPGQEDTDGNGVGDACQCVEPLYVFQGSGAGVNMGYGARGAGDVNGDGYDDIISGAPYGDIPALSGRAFIYSGEDGSLLYTLTGPASGDWFGVSVAGVGDVNADGYDDVVVGAPFTTNGNAYVFTGGPGPHPITIGAGSAFYSFTGQVAGDGFGWSVEGAGDFNDDDRPDLIVGAPYTPTGRAYVYSGLTGGLLDFFSGEGSGDEFGQWVSGAGDVNNDGYGDVIVGGYLNDSAGDAAGRAYVFSGIDGSTLHTFTGEGPSDWFGYSVSGAGDVNGDDYDDVIVAAPVDDAKSTESRRAYVFSGIDGATLYTLFAEEAGGFLGSVGSIGDVDGDGVDDLLLSDPYHGVLGDLRAGQVYIHSGQTGARLLTIEGEASDDWFGGVADGSADVDRDGVTDLVVGAFLNGTGGTNAGRTYVYPLGDLDGDGLRPSCDNCPQGYNPDQGPAPFTQEILATALDTFEWSNLVDAQWVRGDLALVSTYAVSGGGTIDGETELFDPALPGADEGLYYVLKLAGSCQDPSWQTVIGAEPDRDDDLP